MAHHALQCGFCTPGFLMLAVNVLEREPDIGDEEMLDVLSSNLCRCTGYHNIVKAVQAAQTEMRPAQAAGPAPAAAAPQPAPEEVVEASGPIEMLEQVGTAEPG